MNLKPFDLILLNSTEQAWGAHVIVYLGQQLTLHLSKENKLPKIEHLDDLQKNPKYRCYIGAKTVIRSGKSPAKNQQVEMLE